MLGYWWRLDQGPAVRLLLLRNILLGIGGPLADAYPCGGSLLPLHSSQSERHETVPYANHPHNDLSERRKTVPYDSL